MQVYPLFSLNIHFLSHFLFSIKKIYYICTLNARTQYTKTKYLNNILKNYG